VNLTKGKTSQNCLLRAKSTLNLYSIMGIKMSQRFYKLEETEQKKVFK